MKLENYEMCLPNYSIGSGIYGQIKRFCSPYGDKILIISGHKSYDAASPKLIPAIEVSGFSVVGHVYYGKDCTYSTVERLKELPVYQEADMVFAVGGGKCIDTCKCLCIEDGKPIFTFPTIASNCAACTSVSIMYMDDGVFLKPHFFKEPAKHVFIDTEILSQAPARYLWAGIGDTYAKYYEATISSRDEDLPHFTAMGVAVSRMCMEPLVKYGATAYHDNKKHVCSDAFEQAVLAIVVSTGIASIFLTRDFTPDYNSGLAHAIFYALTNYPVIEEKHLHGEVVAYGMLYALLVDGQKEEFDKIYALNRELGLPLKLADIDITEDQFKEIISDIPERSDVAHYPYRVTRQMLLDAMVKLEEM
ncbi:MAG: iron-containing alcohol dehydrogenase family protein [Clostridiales bacterium]|nr:iron-containing alcohol dehydrogenase family protein [Clostridiales bacterium]